MQWWGVEVLQWIMPSHGAFVRQSSGCRRSGEQAWRGPIWS